MRQGRVATALIVSVAFLLTWLSLAPETGAQPRGKGPPSSRRPRTPPAPPAPTATSGTGLFGLPGGAPSTTTVAPALGSLPPPGALNFVRRNVLDLTPAERRAFRDAVFRLRERDPASVGAYREYVETHMGASRHGHNGPAFLPWHRAFLVYFERDVGMAVPYWDWTQPAPEVFTDDLFGGAGNGTMTWTGADGTARTWDWERSAFDPATIQPARPADVRFATQETDFAAFTDPFEGVHGGAHVDVGGRLGSVPTAVEDPIFFMLHSNVDRIWWEWQQARKAEWEAANAGGTFQASQYADYYWDGTDPGGGTPDPIWTQRHQIDSLMWPWDGTASGPATRDRRIQRFVANPISVRPRDMLVDIATLGYSYR